MGLKDICPLAMANLSTRLKVDRTRWAVSIFPAASKGAKSFFSMASGVRSATGVSPRAGIMC